MLLSDSNPLRSMVYASMFGALTAIGAFIVIPLQPIPFTLRTFFTALAEPCWEAGPEPRARQYMSSWAVLACRFSPPARLGWGFCLVLRGIFAGFYRRGLCYRQDNRIPQTGRNYLYLIGYTGRRYSHLFAGHPAAGCSRAIVTHESTAVRGSAFCYTRIDKTAGSSDVDRQAEGAQF